MKKKLKGIDLSHHNTVTDYEKVKDSGIDFVILREGYRYLQDQKLKDHITGCRSAGIDIYGFYHFLYALNENEARAEALSCINNLRSFGITPEGNFVIFCDFEYDTVTNAKQKGVALTASDCQKFTDIFCSAISENGFRFGVYANKDFYNNWYQKKFPEGAEIWVADYTKYVSAYPFSVQQYSNTGSIHGINGDVDLNFRYSEEEEAVVENNRQAEKVVQLARSFIGLNEADGSYKKIIDIYNSQKGPFPRGVKMQYSWSWCACFCSALMIQLGYENLFPIEISCGEIAKNAVKMGIWIEDDSYIPSPGDFVLYDWHDNGSGDCTGWPDHIGVVSSVDVAENEFKVIEGNSDDRVRELTKDIDGRYIRGFVVPKYASKEAILPKDPKPMTSLKFTNADFVEKAYHTTADLNIRSGAGTTHDILVTAPKGSKVLLTGGFLISDFKVWPEVEFRKNEVLYKGFCSGAYLKEE